MEYVLQKMDFENKLVQSSITFTFFDCYNRCNTFNVKDLLLVINSKKNLEIESELINNGAKGVVWLLENQVNIDDVIATIESGGLWFDRLSLSKELLKSKEVKKRSIQLNNPLLTKREVDIAELVVLGFSNKEIANKRCISETTVKSHIKNILRKKNAKNRTALVAIL